MEPGSWFILDQAIIVGALFLLLLGGWLLRSQPAVRDYFLGNRSIPFGLLLVSLVAIDTGGIAFLTLPGLGFRSGGATPFLQLASGMLVGRFVVAFLILPWYFRGEYLSAYQLLGQRLRLPMQQLASALFLSMRIIADGLKLFLAAYLTAELTGLKPGWSILIAGILTLSYATMGGMRSILWTTLFQYLLFTFAALALFLLILSQLPRGWPQFFELGSAAEMLPPVKFWADAKGLRGFAGFQAWFADPGWLFAGLAGGTFLSMASHGCDQTVVQRYLCTSSKRVAQTALMGSAIVSFLQWGLYLAIGIGLTCLQTTKAWDPLGEVTGDRVLVRFIGDQTVPGLQGLMVAAIAAATLASLATSSNAMASAILGDFVRPWYPQMSDKLELTVSRWLVSVCVLLQMAVAWIAWGAIDDQEAIALILEVTSFVAGPILGLFLMAIMPVPVRTSAAIGGVILGFTVVGFLWLPTLWGQPFLAIPWYAPLGALSTWGLGVVLDWPGKKRRSFSRS